MLLFCAFRKRFLDRLCAYSMGSRPIYDKSDMGNTRYLLTTRMRAFVGLFSNGKLVSRSAISEGVHRLAIRCHASTVRTFCGGADSPMQQYGNKLCY